MNIYLVMINTDDKKYAKFIENLNIYHGRSFPMQKKDSVYKIINRDICLVRAGEHWSTGDVLGNLTVEIDLSDDDKFYCIPIISPDDDRIRLNNSYLYEKLDGLKSSLSDNFTQITGIFYLANYFYMLETDKAEKGRIKSGDEYVISDRFQHWTTDNRYSLKVDISSRRSGRGKIIEENVTFSRFSFFDIEEWIRSSARALGFNILFYRNGDLVDDVSENNFIETELVFSGNRNWKEKLLFEVSGKIGARTVTLNKNGGVWEKITRKSCEHVVLPHGLWFDQRYENMIDDVVSKQC